MRVLSEPHMTEFRARAEAFVAAQWTNRTARGDASGISFREGAIAAGLAHRSLPEHCGGLGLDPDPELELAWLQVCEAAHAPARPAGTGVQMLVPTLLAAGTREQQARYVLPALTGSEIWAQGFSEPGSGSDLASLRTRADRHGDSWVINGQKIWTTHAERAHFMFALVRTESDQARHGGISFMLIDLRAGGVDVRPIRQMTDEHEYCEVFLEDVRVPGDAIVGAPGAGWRLANLLLKTERGWIGDFIAARFARLQHLVAQSPKADDLATRTRLVEIEGHVLSHEASALRRLTAAQRQAPTTLIDHVAKLHATNVMSRISDLAADVLADDLLAPSDDPWGDGQETETGYWVRDWYWSMAYAIAGGSSNVQRDVIATRWLGFDRAAR